MRVLYVLVVIEHHSRKLIHFNVTAHPTAQWTRQQLREAVGCEERYAYLLHDRDAIVSAELDESIKRLGLRLLKSPPRRPYRHFCSLFWFIPSLMCISPLGWNSKLLATTSNPGAPSVTQAPGSGSKSGYLSM